VGVENLKKSPAGQSFDFFLRSVLGETPGLRGKLAGRIKRREVRKGVWNWVSTRGGVQGGGKKKKVGGKGKSCQFPGQRTQKARGHAIAGSTGQKLSLTGLGKGGERKVSHRRGGLWGSQGLIRFRARTVSDAERFCCNEKVRTSKGDTLLVFGGSRGGPKEKRK